MTCKNNRGTTQKKLIIIDNKREMRKYEHKQLKQIYFEQYLSVNVDKTYIGNMRNLSPSQSI